MANFNLPLRYKAEFLRGWPMDGGLEIDHPIGAGEELELGDLVKLELESGIYRANKTVLADATSAIGANAGIVVRGNADEKSARDIGKAVILWGHYIVRTTKFDTVGITASGVNVVAGAGGKFVAAAAVNVPSLGHVIEYRAASGSRPAEIIVVVK